MHELGAVLRAAREAQGLSIEDLYAKTKIRPHIIAAIEAGEFESVSVGAVYLRGFIRTLSEELGVAYTHLPLPEAATLAAPANSPSVNYRRVTVIPWRRWVGALIMLAAFVSAGLYYAYWSSPPVTPTEPAPEATLPPPEPPQTAPLPDPPPPPSPAWVLRQSEGIRDVYAVRQWPMELIVRVRTESCWLSVTIDGERFSQTLTAGAEMTFRASKSVNLRLGKARVVDLVINGSPLPALTGDVREFTFVP
ncbi:MAG: hypothetical protein DDT37_01077 [Firmicutes bacterium]|nr:hypothetical protein [candidate division NPL-UPA2 bacterium]